MSYIKSENRDILLALFLALLIHALIFLISGIKRVQPPQYGVQAARVAMEVGLEAPQTFKSESSDTVSRRIKQTPSNQKQSGVQGGKVEATSNAFQNPPPHYPELARQMKQEGVVMLFVTVNREGLPTRVEVEKSSGYRLLDEEALKTVRRWKFQPGHLGDSPVESQVILPIRFRLQD